MSYCAHKRQWLSAVGSNRAKAPHFALRIGEHINHHLSMITQL